MKIGFSGELASLAAVAVAATLMSSAMRAADAKPSVPRPASEPFAAFITLDEKSENDAVRVARSSWKAPSAAALAHGRVRLSYDELPQAPEPGRTRKRRPADIGWIPPPWPSGLSAPPPSADSGETAAPPLPFPREEMLKLP